MENKPGLQHLLVKIIVKIWYLLSKKLHSVELFSGYPLDTRRTPSWQKLRKPFLTRKGQTKRNNKFKGGQYRNCSWGQQWSSILFLLFAIWLDLVLEYCLIVLTRTTFLGDPLLTALRWAPLQVCTYFKYCLRILKSSDLRPDQIVLT